MRDLQLFEQYLIRLRQERLQQAHRRALGSDATLLELKTLAQEAEIVNRITLALKSLEKDSGEFIRSHLT